MRNQCLGVSFLKSLFAGSEAPVFLTSLANDRAEKRRLPPVSIVTRECDLVERFAKRWDQPERAFYFCVATLRPGSGRRAKENLHEIVCLHADLDCKGIASTRAEINKAITAIRLLPSVVVFSGHGLHLYWKLRTPMPATPENIARIEVALRKIAEVFAGDPQVCECARLMRLPGTHNSKNSEWIPVRTIKHRRNTYTIEQVEHWLEKEKPRLLRRPSAKTSPKHNGGESNPWIALGETQAGPIDVEQRLAEMHYGGTDRDGIHDTQLSVTAALLNRGWPVEDVVSHVLAATKKAAGPEGRGWNWREEERGLRKMCRKWREKHPRIVGTEEIADFVMIGD